MNDERYKSAKRAAAEAARRIKFGHPAQWPLPKGEAAQDAFERDLFAVFFPERDDLDDDLEAWSDEQ